MPFMPNVPHIVGDDDDLSEVDDQAQISDAPLDYTTPQSAAEASNSDADGEDSDTGSSEETDSSDEDDSDADEEDSNSSAEEEEDWSNNITYILRTPVREPESLDLLEEAPAYCSSPATVDTEEAQVEQTAADVAMELEDSNTKSDALTYSVPSSPAEENCTEETATATRSADLSPAVEAKLVGGGGERVKKSLLANITIVQLELSPQYRRRSLRSAGRGRPRNVAASTKTARPRQRKQQVNNDSSSSPKTIGARVAKRPRQTVCLPKSPVKKPAVSLAHPIEVTEYFTSISAMLVRNRVSQTPFQYMRKRIDRLVGEVIAKTKTQRENNPFVNVL